MKLSIISSATLSILTALSAADDTQFPCSHDVVCFRNVHNSCHGNHGCMTALFRKIDEISDAVEDETTESAESTADTVSEKRMLRKQARANNKKRKAKKSIGCTKAERARGCGGRDEWWHGGEYDRRLMSQDGAMQE